ncbi:MAG: GspE/PulE/PilB domain-containing protein, partial [Desulfuromonadales bacterium]
MAFERKKIGEILVEMGSLAPAEMRLVLDRQPLLGRRFGEVAIAEGLINESALAQALARQFGLEYFDLDKTLPPAELAETISPELMVRFECVPVRQDAGALTIAIADPTRLRALDDLEMLLDQRLEQVVAPKGQIARLIERGQGSQQMLQDVSEDFKLQLVKETDKGEEVLSIEKLTDDSSPIIRLIDSTLFDALNKRASDIHIETSQEGV